MIALDLTEVFPMMCRSYGESLGQNEAQNLSQQGLNSFQRAETDTVHTDTKLMVQTHQNTE